MDNCYFDEGEVVINNFPFLENNCIYKKIEET